MKLLKIIAESGGTKTDWFGVDENKKELRVTTESFHPLKIDTAFVSRQKAFWKQYDLSVCQLHLYGAGCLQEDKKEIVRGALHQIGFSSPVVDSDLFAAAAAVDSDEGMIAICGTGSVLFKIKNGQLIELRGGLGWEKGDEGGGFYFGKLLLYKLKTENSYPEIKEIIENWKGLDYLISIENNPASKSLYSELASLFSDYKTHLLISSVHLENIRLFIDQYAKNVQLIHFVGSYAYYLKDYFQLVCNEKSIATGRFIERPIDEMSKQLLM